MFLGHLAVGFAAKRLAPGTSLGTLLAASELIDLLFPAFVLAGWEQMRTVPIANPFLAVDFYYPLSHSLVMTAVWALAAALVYWMIRRNRTGAAVVGLVVLSHWVLDLISHKPDMPLYPGESPMLGLGLWYSVAGTIVVELLMLGAGVWIYTAATRTRDRIGTYGLWSFVALMLTLYVSMLLGPPAPDSNAFAWVGLSFSLFFFYAAWFDHHREVKSAHHG
jgi:hypothetical protein